jgi:multidrug efflux pump
VRPPLPRLAFVALGVAVGFWLLTPQLVLPLGWLADQLPARWVSALPPAAVLAGALLGWVFGPAANWLLGWFFDLFNLGFKSATGFYVRAVGLGLRLSAAVLLVYAGLMVLTWWASNELPTGYIPNQDQGRFYIAVQLPDAASLQRTQQVMDHIQRVVQEQEGVVHVTEVAGQSFTLNANGSNFGNFFVTFTPFEERRDPRLSAGQIVERVQGTLNKEIPEASVSLFTPPPVSGLGSASGFKIIIEDRGDLGLPELQKQVENLMAAGNGGHYVLTEKSFALMRAEPALAVAALVGLQVSPSGASPLLTASALFPGPMDPPPQPLLDSLAGLKDRDFLTKDPFAAALRDAVKRADVQDRFQAKRAEDLAQAFADRPKVVSHLFSVFRANVPQLYAAINREQCQTMGVNPKDVFDTLQIYLGSYYVNDFNRFGRTWQVNLQAAGTFRDDPQKIKLLKVRNNRGEMVPLGSVLSIRGIGGPINIGRYNMYPAAAILGNTEPGVSTGQGIEEMERLCHEVLPPGMAFEWTEINYMQVDAAKNIWNNLIFPLAVVFVFLVLAAQYESWALPLAVILVVPMCILGSLAGVAATRTGLYQLLCLKIGVAALPSDINIFTQIGFVVLVGLASKNAILIVEFAKHKKEEGGLSRHQAALAACRLRLRPILMTSFAFILGVVPLLVGTGAGFEMRRQLGVAVFSGMLGVTLFGIFLTPVFFNVIEWLVDTPLFSSARAHQLGQGLYYALGFATLGLSLVPRLVYHLLRHPRGTAGAWPARGTPLAGNGAGPDRNGDGGKANGQPRAPDGTAPPPDDRIQPVKGK